MGQTQVKPSKQKIEVTVEGATVLVLKVTRLESLAKEGAERVSRW